VTGAASKSLPEVHPLSPPQILRLRRAVVLRLAMSTAVAAALWVDREASTQAAAAYAAAAGVSLVWAAPVAAVTSAEGGVAVAAGGARSLSPSLPFGSYARSWCASPRRLPSRRLSESTAKLRRGRRLQPPTWPAWLVGARTNVL